MDKRALCCIVQNCVPSAVFAACASLILHLISPLAETIRSIGAVLVAPYRRAGRSASCGGGGGGGLGQDQLKQLGSALHVYPGILEACRLFPAQVRCSSLTDAGCQLSFR